MPNPLQIALLHGVALYFSSRKVGLIADAFGHHLDSIKAKSPDGITATQIGFRLAAGDSFGRSDKPIEGDNVRSEAIWDWHRALALRSWLNFAKHQAMAGGSPKLYPAFLESVSFVASLSDFNEARVSNRVVSNVYAGLLSDTAKMHWRDYRADLMTHYMSGLRVVWDAAAGHDGHQDNILTRLQMGLEDGGSDRSYRHRMRQVSRFIEESAPRKG